jgi:hypothetical protein
MSPETHQQILVHKLRQRPGYGDVEVVEQNADGHLQLQQAQVVARAVPGSIRKRCVEACGGGSIEPTLRNKLISPKPVQKWGTRTAQPSGTTTGQSEGRTQHPHQWHSSRRMQAQRLQDAAFEEGHICNVRNERHPKGLAHPAPFARACQRFKSTLN